jgi:hypothetical protein
MMVARGELGGNLPKNRFVFMEWVFFHEIKKLS